MGVQGKPRGALGRRRGKGRPAPAHLDVPVAHAPSVQVRQRVQEGSQHQLRNLCAVRYGNAGRCSSCLTETNEFARPVQQAPTDWPADYVLP